MVVHTFNPSTWEAEEETGTEKSEASLVYRAVPGQRKPVLKKKTVIEKGHLILLLSSVQDGLESRTRLGMWAFPHLL